MDLDWLRDFIALAEHGSFSRAADHRHVTQPAFSRRVRALEEWIGTTLFVRGAQGATLTPAGEHFQPLAEGLVRQLERARRETAAAGGRHATSISIAATHALSFTFFPAWIRRHVSLEELGTLSLISDTMAGCEAVMLAGEVHLLLCHHHDQAPVRLEPDRFSSLDVGRDTLMPVCAQDGQGRPRWPIDGTKSGDGTKPARLLAYSAASGLGRILAAHRACADALGKLDTVFTSHLAATLMTMARNGEGAAWLPATLVEDDIEAGRLVRAGGAELDVPVQIRLFRSPDCRNETVDALWEALRLGAGGD